MRINFPFAAMIMFSMAVYSQAAPIVNVRVRERAVEQIGDEQELGKVAEQTGDEQEQEKVAEQIGDEQELVKVAEQTGDEQEPEKVVEQTGDERGLEKAAAQTGDGRELERAAEQTGDLHLFLPVPAPLSVHSAFVIAMHGNTCQSFSLGILPRVHNTDSSTAG
ncbi:hypothetical protein BDP27DRAFT_1403183 [Rhodocollybia butyracea]|uniref:Uncharacterized protein n=1 Tax=Rhodocollybia butyracea TaxID=206335 RepID=A0A9P5PUT3_9AGAR|nr:hypothetical protein BDP27DRAFT_1403183 [Rhodocollybia butyracea]